MDEFSKQEVEHRKKAIFDSMSARGQRAILKRGYDKWDPFLQPKDPIDIRKDKTRRTTRMLFTEFLDSQKIEKYSNAYGQGVLDICMGIINEDDRYIGMFDFSCWYRDLLKKEGHR